MTQVPVVRPPEPPAPETFVCANCHEPLRGEFCSACGQRHEPHIHTVVHFAGEAFESISHADSRLWRTLWLLVSRPGRLTLEFFAGRRVHYLPPFRLYLVLSVLCFLIAGLPGNEPPYTRDVIRTMPDTAPAATQGSDANAAVRDVASAALERAGIDPAVIDEAAAHEGEGLQLSGIEDFCKEFEGPDPGGEGSHKRRNVRQFCAKVAHDNAAVAEAVLHNLPRAMFVFLPLLAAIMKLLYWRPKRYYVEHLLFLIHNHALVFLAVSVAGLLALVPFVDRHMNWVYVALILYLVWYVYRAMRNVYQQGRALTITKYFLLGHFYLVLSFIVLLFTLLFGAMFA